MSLVFAEYVELKFKTYNSLFLDLPFEQSYQTGIYLPLLAEACRSGFDKDKEPGEIIRQFLSDYFPDASPEEHLGLLFRFTQYIERQVLLFDSAEDAAFTILHERSGKGSINQVIDLAEDSGKQEELKDKLNDFGVRVVLTAHPTQFYPSQVLGIQNELQAAIRTNDLSAVQELLNQLGKTPFFKKEKPSPYEEAVRLTWYLENVFYDSIADIIEDICARTGIAVSDWSNTDLIEVGFWPGGDRDGNPFVTPKITTDVARELRETALRCYADDLRNLRGKLTFRGVEDLILKAESTVGNTLYRRGTVRYGSPEELLGDLLAARRELIDFHGSLFLDKLDNLILKVKVFGFFMASLDIRQDSRVHRRGWSQLVRAVKGDSGNSGIDDMGRSIEDVLALDRLPASEDIEGEEAQDLVNAIVTIKAIQRENGEKGCYRYIISNCKEATDVAIVFRSASLVWGTDNRLPLDVVPLFESVEDLAGASVTMESLFRNEAYSTHLAQRGMIQTVMLGFSDGTKDGGYLQANWSIFKAKEMISRVADQYGVKVVFFDGRGGPPSRGGGNTHNFYAALGDRIHNHRIQLTIQGQTISSRYGQPDSCRFNLEQLLTAGLENALFYRQAQSLNDEQRSLLEELSGWGYRKYKDLKEHPQFLDYLAKITPMRFFGQTNIASRPTRRSGGELSLSNLRAIPFVGSWAQMKQNVPGYYGVGTAIKTLYEQGRTGELIQLYRQSLFFRTLLGNSMQSLEKADYKLTRHLARDPEYGDFWKTLLQEYKDSIHYICEVSGDISLMAENPDARKSIKMREDIVLPLTTIQQFALLELRRKETGPWSKDDLEKLVVRTMFGITNASRNAI
jgi:phosphoenolpyruvate carboxylase